VSRSALQGGRSADARDSDRTVAEPPGPARPPESGADRQRRRRRPVRLRTGLLAALLLPALALWIAASWFTHRGNRAILQGQLGDSLASLAAAGASQVRGERLSAIEPGDDAAGLRTWTHLRDQLEQLRGATGLRRVLVVDHEGTVRADTGSLEAGASSVPALPVGALVPEFSQDTRELAQALSGRTVASQVSFTGLDGRDYRRGYAPVRDQDGGVVGVLAVEGSSRAFEALARHARWSWGWGALVALCLTVVAIGVATSLGAPFARLGSAAVRIGRGDLQTPVARESGFIELAAVADALESMRLGLEARDHQLKMMIAGVAHEVKNPLGGMELFGGLLEEELSTSGNTAEARSHLARIRGEIGYLSRIVEDFLAFARERKLVLEPLEATDWLRDALSLVEGEARSRGITLRLHAAPSPVKGDLDLLTAALVNLIKNAVQASAHGMTVEITGEVQAQAYAVHVRDRGPGIPADIQAQVFEPFFTTREQGTGLGLPLTRKLIEAHGGTLTLVSAPGDTCFTLRLPR